MGQGRGDAPARASSSAPILSLGLAALLVISGGVVGAGLALGHGSGDVMWGGSPLAAAAHTAPVAPAGFQLNGLPRATVEAYAFAADHAGVLAQIPCFCGCDRMLGHRDLARCFVTPEGAWESHAAGCDVCLGEARMVMRMMGRGMSPAMMRERIVAEFGGPMKDGPMMGMSS